MHRCRSFWLQAGTVGIRRALLLILFASMMVQSAPLRRPVSNTNPLITFNIYNNTASGFEAQYNAIPNDLKPYSAIVSQFYIGTGWDAPHASYVAKVEELAAKADQLGMWLIYWNGVADGHISFTSAEIDQFFKHPKFLGIGYVETFTTGFCNGAAGYPFSAIQTELSACARNGGIIHWQDYSFQEFCTQKNKFFWTEFPKSLIDSFSFASVTPTSKFSFVYAARRRISSVNHLTVYSEYLCGTPK
jgi:hypothetical protein